MRGILVFVLVLQFSRALSEIIECKWNPNANATTEKVSYAGAQLWKVIVNSDVKLEIILRLEKAGDIQNWDLNDGTYYDILVELKNLKSISNLFKDFNITYMVATNNFQNWIDEANPPSNESHTGHNLSWARYHRLSEIESFIDYLTSTYPSLCTVKTIGTSIEGRLLRVLKISNGRPRNKAVWIDGGIHAREWISPATVTYIIKNLVENWQNEPREIQNIDWHFLPVLNPDGYEFSHTHDRLWRKNRRQNGTCPGTDLSSNFGDNWNGPGSTDCPCHVVYGGSGPFSEPESTAVKNYITLIEKKASWQAFLSFHSFGQVIFHTEAKHLQMIGNQMAKKMQATYGTPYTVVPNLTPGGSDNWAINNGGIKYAFIVELRDIGRRGFVLPAANIKPNGEEALSAVRVIAHAVNKF